MSRVIPIAFLSVASGLTGCSTKHAQGGPPNVLLVSSRDLPLQPDSSTPTLEKLAGKWLRFGRAYSQSDVPALAWASILTGRYPSEVGAGDGSSSAVSESSLLLPEILGFYGYTTAAFVAGDALGGDPGFHQGFSTFREIPSPATFAEASEEAGEWVRHKAREPFLLVVGGDAQVEGAKAMDGSLADLLDRIGHEDRTLLVLTSDRASPPTSGVPLILWGAGISDSGRGGVRTDLVQAVDVLPTILALLGATPPQGLVGRDLLDGTRPPVGSILQFGRDSVSVRSDTHRLVLRDLPPDFSELCAAVATTPQSPESSSLYDLKSDPDEHVDRLADEVAEAEKLRAALLDDCRAHALGAKPGLPATPDPRDDPVLMEELRKRGYW
jgi:arylsulfatase A-like enzyme